jgi:hypothetical protein
MTKQFYALTNTSNFILYILQICNADVPVIYNKNI